MPARLADGLGLGSALSFFKNTPRKIGSPASVSGETDLGYNNVV